MRISDWSSDVCSSDLPPAPGRDREERDQHDQARPDTMQRPRRGLAVLAQVKGPEIGEARIGSRHGGRMRRRRGRVKGVGDRAYGTRRTLKDRAARSEEHTSELQSLMRISYAVFCLKNKNQTEMYHETH